MKLNNRTKFTGWFGLAALGFILVTIPIVAILGDTRLDVFTRGLTGAMAGPGLLLIGRYGFLICQRLEDGERARKELQDQATTPPQKFSAGSTN